MAARAARKRRPRGFSLDDEEEEDGHLMPIDPRLMTERQQLAFLLRTTAHEASDQSSGSSEDEEDAAVSPRPAKKARQIPSASAEEPPTRRGPGRPRKIRRASDASLQVATDKSKRQQEAKPSPSSSSDVAQVDSAQSFSRSTPSRCALCCDYDTAYEASFSDALFLCPSCDQKYPTQQTLGRMCMT
ncbi:Cilia- and flagella-associated protein 44 [Phytophthora boehmeriae]|uniref:Cilia- and flagella-associated protein 44 n=1 Tax=Phytophthora boehmeriae TaxID=109152 RepID=A0A8T1X266_9STRA|nr:Cilia- and flagella-associated protein 44 [Phytophthora boehmeriae]